MRTPRERLRVRITILGAVLAVVVVVALVRSVLLAFNYTCDICLTFQGRTACREAVGRDRDAAVRVALRRACEHLSSTGQDFDECLAKPPDAVSCRQN